MKLTVLICVLIYSLPVAGAELFTATADLENILSAEKDVASMIDQYIYKERKRLHQLRDISRQYQLRSQETQRRGIEFLAHPINAFELVKRLTTDWSAVQLSMRNTLGPEYIQNITSQRENSVIKFPQREDLEGAAAALMRLQDTYKLRTRDIAEGRLEGVERTAHLTAHDCYEIGSVAYYQQDYYHTLMWMQEALARSRLEYPSTADEADILGYLAFAMYKQGNVKRALKLTRQLLKIMPDHPKAKDNIKYYKHVIEKEGRKRRDYAGLPPVVNKRGGDKHMPDQDRDLYESLCRGEKYHTDHDLSKLFCYYKNDTPFLSIAPIKVEVLHSKPKIILFRNIISDKEISVIKELATPTLERATVVNKETNQHEVAAYRISKSAWLEDQDHEVIAQVSKRFEDITGLSMTFAEGLQIANYGLGGHYLPHFDMSTANDSSLAENGNRIATVLTYLSTPTAGGATVFLDLKLTLHPSKNDAVFWHNLYRSGVKDMTTRHAACPVLTGQKWVANKWLHERDQEFRRPCALDENDYE